MSIFIKNAFKLYEKSESSIFEIWYFLAILVEFLT